METYGGTPREVGLRAGCGGWSNKTGLQEKHRKVGVVNG